MSVPRSGWLSRNVDLLAVTFLIFTAAAVNVVSGVVRSPVLRRHLDRGSLEEMRPVIMEIRDEIRRTVHRRIE